MRFDPQAGIVRPEGSKESRRRTGRLPQETVTCNIGTVLDISAGGMRVLCREKPPEKVLIQITDHELPGPLHAELAWTKRSGFFKHEVGMRFVNVTPEMAKCLTSIAGINRYRRAI